MNAIREEKTMRKSSIALLLALVAFLSTGCLRKFPARYSEAEQLSVPLPSGGTLYVSTQNGAIKVESADVTDVQITAQKTVWSRTEEDARQFCKETKVETETQPSGASVFVQLPADYRGNANIAVSITAIVPRSCNLDLDTSNGRVEVRWIDGNVQMGTSNGRIEGQDIKGDVVAETSNGGIRLERVSGSAEAVSSNGKVTIREASGDIRCHTSNGSILLHNVVASAEAVTSNGSIECVIPDNASATVSGSTSNGKIRSEFPLTIRHKRVSGRIGDGKSSIKLRTTNGSISIKRMK